MSPPVALSVDAGSHSADCRHAGSVMHHVVEDRRVNWDLLLVHDHRHDWHVLDDANIVRCREMLREVLGRRREMQQVQVRMTAICR
jgi:hypothetical protein